MQRKEKYRMPSYNNNFVLNCRGKWGTQTCGKSSGFDPVGQQKAATAVIDQGDGLSLACTTDKKAQRVRIEMDTHGEDSKDLHLTEKYNMLHIAKVGMLPSEKNHGNRCLWESEFGVLVKKYHTLSSPTPKFYQRMQLFSLLVHMAGDNSQLLCNTKAEMSLKMLWAVFHGVQWTSEWISAV